MTRVCAMCSVCSEHVVPVRLLKREKTAGQGDCTLSPTAAFGQHTTESHAGRQPTHTHTQTQTDTNRHTSRFNFSCFDASFLNNHTQEVPERLCFSELRISMSDRQCKCAPSGDRSNVSRSRRSFFSNTQMHREDDGLTAERIIFYRHANGWSWTPRKLTKCSDVLKRKKRRRKKRKWKLLGKWVLSGSWMVSQKRIHQRNKCECKSEILTHYIYIYTHLTRLSWSAEVFMFGDCSQTVLLFSLQLEYILALRVQTRPDLQREKREREGAGWDRGHKLTSKHADRKKTDALDKYEFTDTFLKGCIWAIHTVETGNGIRMPGTFVLSHWGNKKTDDFCLFQNIKKLNYNPVDRGK